MVKAELVQNAFNILNRELGLVETERFITIIQKEKFNYTEWRKNLWQDKDVKELSAEAMDYWIKK
jgi:hypothetical protein